MSSATTMIVSHRNVEGIYQEFCSEHNITKFIGMCYYGLGRPNYAFNRIALES